jgi:diguanylate cyclase (GGDEF)-like protein
VFHVTCQPLAHGGWVDVHEEITEKLRSEEKIVELTRIDNLTGLSNRRHFHEAIEAAIRADEPEFAILWIDLDKFKDVNDTYGHPTGDALLCAVAQRLKASVRGTDFVARLGGDEFAIIMRAGSGCRDAASALAGRLCNILSQPCEVAGHTVAIGASIGIAMSPECGRSAEDLMRNADVALYRAKGDGRGGYVFFTSELEQSLQRRRRLEADLKTALAAGQLELHYQPIVDLRLGGVASCEALMRWTHPELGPVSPADFIPLAEATGLIVTLGAWAIREACRAASTWPGGVGVSVNLSAAQFTSSDLVAITESALADSGLPARRLELEVTETLLLRDEPRTRETLHDLRLLGVSIALDDFGTGYSSLSYLRNYPFDTLKIDQAFVRDINQREGTVAIVKAINELARSLGMRTVAEGVESLAHLEQVRAAGCARAQGYYFSKPVPESKVVEVLTGCAERAAA